MKRDLPPCFLWWLRVPDQLTPCTMCVDVVSLVKRLAVHADG